MRSLTSSTKQILPKTTSVTICPRSLFLPIDRAQILDILTIQDDIADKAEDIGQLLAIRPLPAPKELKNELVAFFDKSIETFWDARKIMKEIGELLESSFGGLEAEKVKAMVEGTSFKEHEADVLKGKLRKNFFAEADNMSPTNFYLWVNLIEEVGAISHISRTFSKPHQDDTRN